MKIAPRWKGMVFPMGTEYGSLGGGCVIPSQEGRAGYVSDWLQAVGLAGFGSVATGLLPVT